MRLQIVCDGKTELDIEVDRFKLTKYLPTTWHGPKPDGQPDIKLTATLAQP